MNEKYCSYHQTNHPIEEFYPNPNTGDGYQNHCKEHNNELAGLSYQRDRAKTVLALSDPPMCKRCGYSDLRALTIDHISGGGGQQRKLQRSSTVYYRHVREHPSEFQLLCQNCNFIKKIEEKECGKAYFEKHSGQQYPSTKSDKPQWSRSYDACIECGTTKVRHHGKGYCQNCFQIAYMRSKGTIPRKQRIHVAKTGIKWHENYECCLACWTITVPHKGHGLCENCHRRSLKRLNMEIEND